MDGTTQRSEDRDRPTHGGIARDDVVADGNARDALAHALDDRARLVAEDRREEPLGVGALESIKIGVADSVGHHLEAHLAWARRRDVDSGDAHIVDGIGNRGVALDGLAAGRVGRIRDRPRRRRRA